MSVWRRFLLGFAVGVLLAIAFVMARAQGAAKVTDVAALTVGDKQYDSGKELARMAKRYGLTEEQKAKVQPLLLEQQRQVHELGEDASLSEVEWASQVRKVHAQTVAKVKLLLTDEQAMKYAKDEAKRKKTEANEDGMDGPPDGPPPGPPPGGFGPPGD